MLIIDNYDSYTFIEFDEYCKFNNIITITMPVHSSHLLQPLNIELYSSLKVAYGY